MPGYILCQTPMAREAYFIENIQMNIYSLEELCYYLRRNLYLVDETLLGEELVFWISNELKLPALGAKLKARLSKKVGVEEFLFPIFKEINYLSYEEMKALSHEILAYQNQSPRERLVQKGRSFLRNGMYMKATGIFQDLLLSNAAYEGMEKKPFPDFLVPISEVTREEGDKQEALRSAAYLEGLGLCSTRLFQMEKACEQFWQAYVLSGQEKFLEKSLLALRAALGEKAFWEKVEGLEIPATVITSLEDQFSQMKEGFLPAVGEEEADAYLDQFMKQYHRSMTP